MHTRRQNFGKLVGKKVHRAPPIIVLCTGALHGKCGTPAIGHIRIAVITTEPWRSMARTDRTMSPTIMVPLSFILSAKISSGAPPDEIYRAAREAALEGN